MVKGGAFFSQAMHPKPRRPIAFRPGRCRSALPLALASCLAMVSTGGWLCGCSKDSAPGSNTAAPPLELSPIPRPAGLVAELWVPKPDATWSKWRTTAGGSARFLPSNVGALATSLLGLPATLMTEVDGGIAALGALVEDGGALRGALGIHVQSGDRVIVALTKGNAPRFSARQDPATSITMLEPLGPEKSKEDAGPGGTESPVALGILGNYLLAGRTPMDLTAAGPYIVRTLSKAPVPADEIAIEIPESALSGPILARTRSVAERLGARGSGGSAGGTARTAGAQLLADPPFSQMIQSAAAAPGDLQHARISINIDAQAVHLRVTGTPKSAKGPVAEWIAGMHPGDPQRLLDLPSDTVVGLWAHGTAKRRDAGPDPYAQGLSVLLGPSAIALDRDSISAAFQALSDARGEWMTLGVSFSPTGPSAYLRCAVTDDQKLSKSVKDLFALSKLPRIRTTLKEKGLGISTGKTAVEGFPGEVQKVRIERLNAKTAATAPPKEGSPLLPASIELLYALDNDTLVAATGYQAKQAWVRTRAAPGGDNLGKNPTMKALIGALGTDVTFVLAVEPLRWIASQAGQPGAGQSAPVIFAQGRDAPTGDAPPVVWWRLDVAQDAVQEFVKRGAAF